MEARREEEGLLICCASGPENSWPSRFPDEEAYEAWEGESLWW